MKVRLADVGSKKEEACNALVSALGYSREKSQIIIDSCPKELKLKDARKGLELLKNLVLIGCSIEIRDMTSKEMRIFFEEFGGISDSTKDRSFSSKTAARYKLGLGDLLRSLVWGILYSIFTALFFWVIKKPLDVSWIEVWIFVAVAFPLGIWQSLKIDIEHFNIFFGINKVFMLPFDESWIEKEDIEELKKDFFRLMVLYLRYKTEENSQKQRATLMQLSDESTLKSQQPLTVCVCPPAEGPYGRR